jgi:hypothetical protein
MNIKQAGAHLDHLMRQTRMHHVQLSTMADAKANALTTISAVITTFSAGFVARPGFQAAVIVLMCFSLCTILLATIAVMPTTPLRISKRPAVRLDSPYTNLLFFGTFANMQYEQYEKAMEEIMNDPSRTYEAQVREVYLLGCFLAEKKYRYLRLAYLSFLTGLFSAGAVLVITHLWPHA